LLRRLGGYINECDFSTLQRKRFYQRCANARRAAGYKYALPC
jgi:hypothetical protein